MGPKFRRQHTVGPYTLDFYCPVARVAVELDGGQHYEGVQRAKDGVRDEWLAKRGIRVLRYSDRDVLLEMEAVEEAIWGAISANVRRTPRAAR
jgi:very-short-patch-repair endonuclease